MSVYELRNSTISVKIDSHGAELKSLQRLDTGTEYMWCGDAKYWGRTSGVRKMRNWREKSGLWGCIARYMPMILQQRI